VYEEKEDQQGARKTSLCRDEKNPGGAFREAGMNYSEKLKDRRWLQFREEFMAYRRRERERYEDQCDDCGQDTAGPIHVHHKRYIDGREPWHYDFTDLRLLCDSCHRLIHNLEDETRQFIRTLPPWACHEFRDMMDEVRAAHSIDEHCMQIACAHAKNAIRSVVHGYGKEASSKDLQTMEELESVYRAWLLGGK